MASDLVSGGLHPSVGGWLSVGFWVSHCWRLCWLCCVVLCGLLPGHPIALGICRGPHWHWQVYFVVRYSDGIHCAFLKPVAAEWLGASAIAISPSCGTLCCSCVRHVCDGTPASAQHLPNIDKNVVVECPPMSNLAVFTLAAVTDRTLGN
jgi:hypothetical protein